MAEETQQEPNAVEALRKQVEEAKKNGKDTISVVGLNDKFFEDLKKYISQIKEEGQKENAPKKQEFGERAEAFSGGVLSNWWNKKKRDYIASDGKRHEQTRGDMIKRRAGVAYNWFTKTAIEQPMNIIGDDIAAGRIEDVPIDMTLMMGEQLLEVLDGINNWIKGWDFTKENQNEGNAGGQTTNLPKANNGHEATTNLPPPPARGTVNTLTGNIPPPNSNTGRQDDPTKNIPAPEQSTKPTYSLNPNAPKDVNISVTNPDLAPKQEPKPTYSLNPNAPKDMNITVKDPKYAPRQEPKPTYSLNPNAPKDVNISVKDPLSSVAKAGEKSENAGAKMEQVGKVTQNVSDVAAKVGEAMTVAAPLTGPAALKVAAAGMAVQGAAKLGKQAGKAIEISEQTLQNAGKTISVAAKGLGEKAGIVIAGAQAAKANKAATDKTGARLAAMRGKSTPAYTLGNRSKQQGLNITLGGRS